MAAHKFAMSRSARITLLLIIDVVFFFVELIVGKSLIHICVILSFIFIRLCGRIPRFGGRQLPYAQVRYKLPLWFTSL